MIQNIIRTPLSVSNVLLKRNNVFIHSSKQFCKKTGLDLWAEDINTNIKIKIEERWKNEVLSGFKKLDNSRPFYVLPMFPYPSGNLHMGHVRVYSISDTMARFQNMSGYNIIHPMGWDAFGLPAENAAILHKIPPSKWTKENIASMKNQLGQLGFNFDWSREISTCDPEYYKWTQYIFLKLHENGMAYQNKALVNWDPIDQTVLADEQVDELGCSWRSGAKVEKKFLKQWFVKTTKFAQQLYEGLNDELLKNWKDIINLQQHWIGPCDGVVVSFDLHHETSISMKYNFDVWTSDPYKFIHGDFLLVSKEHVLAKDFSESIGKDLRLPIFAYNPIAETKLPIYVTDAVDYPEGRNVYIACSSSCVKDLELAKLLSIPTDSEVVIDLKSDSQKAVEIGQKKGVGGYFVSSKLKDWLISRQRYWGTPIPIIHCDSCGPVPVPYSDLPVKLPSIDSNSQLTLKDVEDWVNCVCPSCEKPAKRETDTMDTFVDSSWYYYRFLDPSNDEMPFDKTKLKDVAPVNIYIGGKEHAVLHLYYARFMSYFFHYMGWTPNSEPFKNLLVQGMVMGKSYKLKSSGRYVPESEVETTGKDCKHRETGEPVIVDWEKMSKSKFNGENPETLLATYGCDTTRLFMLADVPPPTARRWSNSTFPGVLNWQHRLWLTIRDLLKHRNNSILYNKNNDIPDDEFKSYENKLWTSRNHFIAAATYYVKYTQMLSVAISRLQAMTSVLRNNLPPEVIAKSGEYELTLGSLIIMLAPFAPHFSSELWSGLLSAPNRVNDTSTLLDWHNNVLSQRWPNVDDHYELSLLCKVDGADRCELKIKATELNTFTHDQALEVMLKENEVTKRVKRGILETKFDLYYGSRGILNIFTDKKIQKLDKKKIKTSN